jgi:predicted dehydrogenase
MHRRRFLTTATATLASVAHSAAADAPLKVGIIGDTPRGGYGHGLDTMWLKIPGAQIVAVADPDAKGLASALKKLNCPQGHADYTKMLAAAKPDIVSIGPRHVDQHHAMILASIAAGVRGIYIEKPFCRSLVEADEIVAAAEKSGTKISIAHRNRFHPALPVVQKLVTEGAIGRVLEYRMRGKEDPRGGSLDLWVLGSHLFNLAAYFGGPPIACTAGVYQAGKPLTKADVIEGAEGIGPLGGNEVHARFEMTNGTSAFFDSIQNAGTKTAGFGLQIIGTEGVIDFRIDQEPLAHIRLGSPFSPKVAPAAWMPITTAGIGKPEPIVGLGRDVSSHAVGARDLIDAMTNNRQPLCSAADGRTTIEMISAIFESHRLQGRRVTFPLETRVNPLSLL